MKTKSNHFEIVLTLIIGISILLWGFLPSPGFCKTQELVIAGAASLTDALTEITQQYETSHPTIKIHLNLASSGVLQQQIEQGAPIDVFLSASSVQMDKLEKKSLIIPESRFTFASNQIVLAVPTGSKVKSWSDLTTQKVKRIAIGNPDTVPAGMYAKEALTSLKLWDQVQSKLVMAENVRQAMTYVQDHNVEAGLLFKTDTLAGKSLQVAALAPANSHRKIEYPAAIIKSSHTPLEAEKFIQYLKTRSSKSIFEKWGFILEKPQKKAAR